MNRREPEDSGKSQRRGLNATLTCLLISAPLFLVQIFSASRAGEDRLPVSIRATSQADYRQDSQTFMIPPINGNILNQIIENIPGTYSVQDRLETLQADLSSPVPTMTGSSQPLTPTPTLLPQLPTSTVAVPITPTSIPPMATATPRITPTPTTTSIVNPSDVPLPLPTIITIPSLIPTILPLPTLPPLLPTMPPLLPTLPPLLPTVPPLLPTLPPLFR